MKITHICLCGPVTDNWTYQDNLLPKYHKKLGYDVSVITSHYIWNDRGKIDVDYRNTYFNEYGIKTIRIESKYKTTVQSKFKRYKNLYETICNENPDILFIHGLQFLDINEVVRFLKHKSEVKVYIDNHADFSNSASNWISKNILHKIVWKRCGKLIEPYVTKFFGVLPARVDFLKNVYKLPEKKIELLVMGADDDKVKESKDEGIKNSIREKYNIKPNDFLIITGGKIDLAKKQTLLLMQAVKKIDRNNVKLIVFGSVSDELKEIVNTLADNDKIQYIGWISPEDSYKYFGASDLVVFPGRHSVFWEQVVGLGIPMIVKYWEGTTHVDVGGNCKFLYKDTVEEIYKLVSEVINCTAIYKEMSDIAKSKQAEKFLYSNIALRSIGLLDY